MVVALILAAGLSTRMGRPKALLSHPSTGRSFVRYLVDTFREGGIDRVLVVGRSGDVALAREVEEANAVFVANPHADRGQLSSLQAGLDAVAGTLPDAIVVTPVDLPLISADVVARLVESTGSTPASIIRPVFAGRHGHPVLFRRAVFEELRAADPAAGARAVVRADPSRVFDLPVNEPGVLRDVDTPDDYARLTDVD